MAPLTTYNGWIQALPEQLTRVHVGGMSAQVRAGDVATMLGAFLADFAREVEPIARLYGWRSIATNAEVGGDPRSTHLSGTAVDVNGHIHPWEKRTGTARYPARGGFTTAQLAALRRVLARYPVIAWGGDYPKGQRDAMHFDIRATAAAVAAAADRIRSTGGADVLTYQDVMNAIADTARKSEQFRGAIRDLVWKDTTIRRDGKDIPVVQELADAKTAALAAQAAAARAEAKADTLLAIVRDIPGVDPKALTDAVRAGINGARITT